MTIALDTPILDGGIRNTHWFQGRLLAAEDLQTEQDANRTHHEVLGRAIGAGIIGGLMAELVTAGASPTVRVRPGSGLNRLGQLVYLGEEVVLALAGLAPGAADPEAGLFGACARPSGAGTVDGDGVYLLTARPASGFRERAPASGLEANGKVTGCGLRYAVEGVSFRLVPWVPSAPPGQDSLVDLLNNPASGNLSLLRNRVAHRFLGSETLDAIAQDPFRPVDPQALPGQPGALSDLYRAGQIDDCDLPLALMYWPVGGVRYLDPWPVRREPTPDALEPQWAAHLGSGMVASGRARLLQFQVQLDWLLGQSTALGAADVRALRDFRFLPPLALLPVHPGALGLPSGVGARGIAPLTFFNDIPTVPLRQIDGALLPSLVEQSLRLPPLDLARGELIQVFQATQNAAAVAAGSAPPYFVIAAGTLAWDFAGRLSSSRFNRADYA